jgi:membrane protease YdiL (CAAX protease family)
MTTALTSALLIGGSGHSWIAFGLGAAAGLAFVLLFKRSRRKEDR